MKNRLIFISTLLVVYCLLLSPHGFSVAQASEVLISAPRTMNVALSGVELDSGFRYTASLIKPDELMVEALYLEVKFPEIITPTQVLTTEQLQFEGMRQQGNQTILSWFARDIEPHIAIDAISFVTESPISTDIETYAEWVATAERHYEIGSTLLTNKPALTHANLFSDAIIIGAEGTGGEMLPVGGTGVLIGVGANQLLEETEIVVSKLPSEANPPAEVGDFWWCSLVQIEHIPEGAAVSVIVPLRRPIAPFTPVTLFRQNADGTWEQIPQQGIVTADGQSVAYVHTGGVIATGVSNEIRPVNAELVEAPDEVRRGQVLSNLSQFIPVEDDIDMNTLTIMEDEGIYPPCDLEPSPVTTCRMFDGVFRQCLAGYTHCVFMTEDFGICFDPGGLGDVDGALQCQNIEGSPPPET